MSLSEAKTALVVSGSLSAASLVMSIAAVTMAAIDRQTIQSNSDDIAQLQSESFVAGTGISLETTSENKVTITNTREVTLAAADDVGVSLVAYASAPNAPVIKTISVGVGLVMVVSDTNIRIELA